ncbi:MAG: zinc ribbon domain-containing protein [Chthonomonas sp.]|nr:zinc ribbon domain-containing protein [Chthonomonas sp.]
MPIYEYEHKEESLMCPHRIEVLQSVKDDTLTHCPACGMEISRVISRASIAMGMGNLIETAGKNGFTAFKKLESGVYERVAGTEGPSILHRDAVDKLTDD